MNFYNPYIYSMPETSTNFFSKISFSKILNGTSKTLNVINQAIPIVKQISPIINNAKTMFKVLNEFKKNDNDSNNDNIITSNSNENTNGRKINNTNLPTFFI